MKLKVTKHNRKYLHLGFALEFIIIGLLLTTASKATTYDEQDINKFCAKVTGIPYASDNFTDEEYQRFLYCRNTLNPKN